MATQSLQRTVGGQYGQNQIYAQKIMTSVNTSVKEATAYVAVAALRAALEHTYQDSGRFANNWFLRVGTSAPRQKSLWRRGTYPVGERGEKRTLLGGAQIVQNEKLRQLKAGTMGGPIRATPFVQQYAGEGGRMPHIVLYNPLYGWDRDYRFWTVERDDIEKFRNVKAQIKQRVRLANKDMNRTINKRVAQRMAARA